MKASALISTVFGIGYFPRAQGTVMSALAMPPAIALGMLPGGNLLLLSGALAALVAGVYACEQYVRDSGNPDPSECVIDELAGQWLACVFVAWGTFSLPAFLLAFILFRLFDIWKPGPVGWAESRLPGGLGVMMDDIVAGLMAGILAFAAHYWGL